MKPIFNALSPFFDNEGKLLTAGRVMFCALGSDSELIHVTDLDGVSLPNPLPLNDCGRFADGLQPFVGDSTSYTALVQKRAYAPVLGDDGYDDSPSWETIYTFDVVGEAVIDGSHAGSLPIVPTIDALRNLDPAISASVMVVGYNRAGDAPSKVYSWEKGGAFDNGGSFISSYANAAGCWVMEQGETDSRNWGIFPYSGDVTADFQRCFSSIDGNYVPLTIPGGTFDVSENLAFGYSLHLSRETKFRNVSTTNDVTLVVYELECYENSIVFIDNIDEDKPFHVIPCLRGGILRSIWFGGDLQKIYTNASAVGLIEEIHYGADLGDYTKDTQKNFIYKPFELSSSLRRIVWPTLSETGMVENWNETIKSSNQFLDTTEFKGGVNLLGKTKAFDDVEIDSSASLIAKGNVSVGCSLNVNGDTAIAGQLNVTKAVASSLESTKANVQMMWTPSAVCTQVYATRYVLDGGTDVYKEGDVYGGDGSSWLRIPPDVSSGLKVFDLSAVDVSKYNVGQIVMVTSIYNSEIHFYVGLTQSVIGKISWRCGFQAKVTAASCESHQFVYLGSYAKSDGTIVPCWSIVGRSYTIVNP